MSLSKVSGKSGPDQLVGKAPGQRSISLEIRHMNGSTSEVTVTSVGRPILHVEENALLKTEACMEELEKFVKTGEADLIVCGVTDTIVKKVDFKKEIMNLDLPSKNGFLSQGSCELIVSSLNVEGILMGVRGIILDAKKLKITGHIVAGSIAKLDCTQCDFSQAHFFGMEEWIVNGKTCSLTADHKLDCPAP